LDNKASVEKAIEGAYGVFAVTNFWEKVSAEIEIQQGKNVADACKKAQVKHLVWSSLINVKEGLSSAICISIGERLTSFISFRRKAEPGAPF
jgi:hypothetical protein